MTLEKKRRSFSRGKRNVIGLALVCHTNGHSVFLSKPSRLEICSLFFKKKSWDFSRSRQHRPCSASPMWCFFALWVWVLGDGRRNGTQSPCALSLGALLRLQIGRKWKVGVTSPQSTSHNPQLGGKRIYLSPSPSRSSLAVAVFSLYRIWHPTQALKWGQKSCAICLSRGIPAPSQCGHVSISARGTTRLIEESSAALRVGRGCATATLQGWGK